MKICKKCGIIKRKIHYFTIKNTFFQSRVLSATLLFFLRIYSYRVKLHYIFGLMFRTIFAYEKKKIKFSLIICKTNKIIKYFY